jgi:acyl-coenzyme A synthetase/AMP-(fatty) acid ligase
MRLGLTGSHAALLGTVPPQHMYGLESTLMMPLQAGIAIHGGRPFYPADVCDAVRTLPRPRLLVTTPVHLRTLISEASAFPALDLIICATAPLTPQLAAQAEAQFGCPLHEIYGCTEAGQVATRRTVETAEWQALPEIAMRQDEKGAWVSGGHVRDEILLSDMIELRDRDRFVLHGRKADLVNIAGKRTSLAHLNYHLNSIEGVQDGVFIVPEETGESVARLMAFVVAPEASRSTVLEALRARIDPAFMPRPLSFVAALPRNATGKLPHAALQALASEVSSDER